MNGPAVALATAADASTRGGRMGVIDVDSHVTEPPDLWTSRVSTKWGDLVPHVKWTEDSAMGGKGEWGWFIGDNKIAAAYASACAGFEGQFPEYARTPEE